ncbi:adenosylcobinamide amidohydrolase [Paenibacillus sp. N3.4]|uniref:adenosylcobinamide amidohydrolase n=1 Tax=Paenibacillus sp. N3.4 TaxID=2603222 RepID=UPI0011C81AB5|nr:adenosylcobinamide amidohydrolase [Paenibacillus sp. N3.4]TXK85973.1 adenosylcobinamide amidohydrolase [Paenibacillus sp. N3.4]
MTPNSQADRNEALIRGIQMQYVESSHGTYLWIHSETSMRTLNSSPWGGGFGSYKGIMNRQVDMLYNEADPIGEMHDFMTVEGLNPLEAAGMLTAAIVNHVGFCSMTWEQDEEVPNLEPLQVCVWATVGLGNKARAGAELPASSLYPGTINTIVVINGKLTDAAMVNAVITATEAKSAALQALNVHVGDLPATGTTTDAVVIAATDRGPLYAYAGTATRLGYLIGRTVYEAILASCQLSAKTP